MDPWSWLVDGSSQIGEFHVLSETLSQKIKWETVDDT